MNFLRAPLAGACLLAAVGCSGDPSIDDGDVIVARTDTACSPVKGPVVLGEADSAFGCRGALLASGGSVVGVARAGKDDPYTLLVAFEKDDVDTATSEHRGNATALVPTTDGFLFFSVDGSKIKVTAHAGTLAAKGPATWLEASDGAEIASFIAFTSSTRLAPTGSGAVKTLEPAEPEQPRVKTLGEAGKEGEEDKVKTIAESKVLAPAVVVVALTANGPDVFYLDPAGTAVATRRPLSFGEPMPYCNSVRAGFADDSSALTVLVGCQDVLPGAPAIDKGSARVETFEYDGDIPPQIGIETSLDATGMITAASLVDIGAEPAPPRYELVRYITEQLPRAAGHRVNVMDAVPVGDDKIVALSCVGPDGGSVELQATLLSCQGLPK